MASYQTSPFHSARSCSRSSARLWPRRSSKFVADRVSRLFSRYVPDTVAKELLDSDAVEAAASGQRLDVAVLFADIRGFTPVAATLNVLKSAELLDVYYEVMTTVIRRYEGTVMQFVGDEVFAVFGAPVPRLDAAAAALRCAAGHAEGRARTQARIDRSQSSPSAGIRNRSPLRRSRRCPCRDDVPPPIRSRRRHRRMSRPGYVAWHAPGEAVYFDAVVEAAGDIPDAEQLGALELKGVSRSGILGTESRHAERPGEPTAAGSPPT